MNDPDFLVMVSVCLGAPCVAFGMAWLADIINRGKSAGRHLSNPWQWRQRNRERVMRRYGSAAPDMEQEL